MSEDAGLAWMGSLETCDLCGIEVPMSWIIFTGRQFLCYACFYPGPTNKGQHEKQTDD